MNLFKYEEALLPIEDTPIQFIEIKSKALMSLAEALIPIVRGQ